MHRVFPHPRALLHLPPVHTLHFSPHTFHFSTSPASLLAAERLPASEFIRRKLWGTDTPPGDPYSAGLREVPGPVSEPEIPDRSLYVAAADARALQIAGLAAPRGVWEIDSFFPIEPLKDPEPILRGLHRAVVEVFTTRFHGQLHRLDIRSIEPEDLTDRVEIHCSKNDNQVNFDYTSKDVELAILNAIKNPSKYSTRHPTVDGAYPPLETKPRWLKESLKGKFSWMEVPLYQDVKFPLIKRIMQLTGIQIPDVAIWQAATVFNLYKKMIVWPKPKKLAEQLVVSEVARVGNVKVFTSRVRPLDKERAIGRAGAQEDVMDHKYVGIDRPQRIFKGHVRWSR